MGKMDYSLQPWGDAGNHNTILLDSVENVTSRSKVDPKGVSTFIAVMDNPG